MDILGTVALFLILWISCKLLMSSWKGMHKRNSLPPGPTPLPFIGNLLQIKCGKIVSSLLSLREKYGPVFTVYLGSRRVIVMCGYDAVKEALIDQGDDFSGRGANPSFDKVYKNYGFVFSNNIERWRHLRRFALMTLRNFGMGKRNIDERIQEEAQFLLEELRKTKEKIQEEIDHVIGPDRLPNSEDRRNMPYTDAVIHEIQRFIDLAPFGLPHSVIRDTEFRGYTIPEGTDVFFMLGSVLLDATQIRNPGQFNPEHFLDENGGFKKNDAFMPFSAGKRVCVAEGLARMELFLFFTAILQTFDVKSICTPEEIDISPFITGFGKFPQPYKMCVVPR